MFGRPILLRQCLTALLRQHLSPLWTTSTRSCLSPIVAVANAQIASLSKPLDPAEAEKKPRKRMVAEGVDKLVVTQERSSKLKSKLSVVKTSTAPPKKRAAKSKVGNVITSSSLEAPKKRGRPRKTQPPPDAVKAALASKRKTRTRKASLKTSPRIAYLTDPAKHHDLDSYTQWIEDNGKPMDSKVCVGTRFEYLTIEVLRRYHFDLVRRGRRNDLGVDLIGQWLLPSKPEPQVIVQCKKAQATPAQVRELEGAFPGARAQYSVDISMALLVSAKSATKGVQEAVTRCRLPMAFVQIVPNDKITSGVLEQIIWNDAAKDAYLTALTANQSYVKAKSMLSDSSETSLAVRGPLVLSWDGKPFTNTPA